MATDRLGQHLENGLKAIADAITKLAKSDKPDFDMKVDVGLPSKVINLDESFAKLEQAIEEWNVDNRNGVFLKDGKYHVWVMIQDGHEYCGSFDNRDAAIEKWYQAEGVYNGMKRDELVPPIYEVIQSPPVVRYQYKRIQ